MKTNPNHLYLRRQAGGVSGSAILLVVCLLAAGCVSRTPEAQNVPLLNKTLQHRPYHPPINQSLHAPTTSLRRASEAFATTTSASTSTSTTTSTTEAPVAKAGRYFTELQIGNLMKCHAQDGGVAYQAGYDDCCDYNRAMLKLSNKTFRTGPSSGFKPMFKGDENVSVTFRVNPIDQTVDLNATVYAVELYRGSHLKSLAILNMTNATDYHWVIHLNSYHNPKYVTINESEVQ
jgi:hypothetical protein